MPKPNATQAAIEQLAKQVAELQQAISTMKQQPEAREVRVVARKRERGEARPDVHYVLLGIPSKGLPPQAIACAKILATAKDPNRIPESEAMELIETGKEAKRLKTTQPAWYIFQYYRPRLIEGDYLRMVTE